MSMELHQKAALPRPGGSLLAMLAVVLLLCLPSLWNGQPFFYPDTPTYMRGAEMGASKVLGPGLARPWQPAAARASAAPGKPSAGHPAGDAPAKSITSVEDKVVLAGRRRTTAPSSTGATSPVACGGWSWSMPCARPTSCTCSWCGSGGLGERHFVATAAVLAAASPLGIFTGLLMPDLFAGLGILAVGMLAVYWQRLSRWHRVALTVLLLFALCAHASHVALVAAMLLVGLAARMYTQRWRHLPRPRSSSWPPASRGRRGRVGVRQGGREDDRRAAAAPAAPDGEAASTWAPAPSSSSSTAPKPVTRPARSAATTSRQPGTTSCSPLIPTRALSGWPMRRASGAWPANSCDSSWMCCATTRWACSRA